jgi:hypothetical protein
MTKPRKKAPGKFAVPFNLRTPWTDSLRLELARADNAEGLALDRMARIVVKNALAGDMDCIEEIANRLQGKAGPSLSQSENEGLSKLIVEWGTKPKLIEHDPL